MAEEYDRPNYGDCDGFTIPGAFSVEAFRSGINYKPNPGDLFVVTYPKCGTTWVQNIVMLILRKGKPIQSRMEFMMSTPFLELTGADGLDFMQGPGAIKTHLPLRLIQFSPNAKYIYVARNPKDCCVSFYYHTKGFPFYNFEDGTFDEYFELFINGKTDYGDYFDHLIPWYERRGDPNVYFVTYEDLKKDTKAEILKIAKFMGDEHYEGLQNNQKELDDVLHYSSLEYMKKIMNGHEDSFLKEGKGNIPEGIPLPSGIKALFAYAAKNPKLATKFKNDFIRKGVVGDWRNHFTPEQENKMDEWIKRKTEESDVMNLWNDVSD